MSSFAARFDTLFRQQVEHPDRIETMVAKAVDSASLQLHERAVLDAAYGQQDGTLRFVNSEGLNDTGRELWRQLQRSSHHGLDPTRYQVEAIGEVLSRLEILGQAAKRYPLPGRPSDEQLQRVGVLLRAMSAEQLQKPGALPEVMQRLVHHGSPLPHVAEAFGQARKARYEYVFAVARLELLLADGLLRYVRDLGRGNTKPAKLHARWQLRDQEDTKQDEVEPLDEIDSQPQTQARPLVLRDESAYVHERLLQDLQSVGAPQSIGRLLADATPDHPQYRQLIVALARYRKIAKAGGWSRLRSQRGLRPDRRSAAVLALKRRLATEGYFEGRMDRRYDHALVAAIKNYQRAHQLQPTGVPNRATWRSLNVPVSRRVQAIETTLHRWRHSGIGDDNYYALVNVPDYHVEVWKGGKRVLRNRVVVGKPHGSRCDERRFRRVLKFATPLQSARIERLVFSPYWNVTRDIKEQELDPEQAKDPLFYRKHGYERLGSDGADQRVRQLPGPRNALGFVKFIFPNPYNTYMHDTPKKHLFKRNKRAFSHGCMRVQQAWDVARALLQADGQWDEQRYQRLRRRWWSMNTGALRSGNSQLYARLRARATTLQRTVKLSQPVPIHVEYYTVRVDDDGQVNFLPDVYRHDRDLALGRRPARCTPETVLVRRRIHTTLERLAALEQQTVALDWCVSSSPELEQAVRDSESRRKRWLVRRLQGVAKLFTHHDNMAGEIRQQHAAVMAELEQRGGKWSHSLVRRAVRVERLLKSLGSMTRRATQACTTAKGLSSEADPLG